MRESDFEHMRKAIEEGSIEYKGDPKTLRMLEVQGLLFSCHFPAESKYYPTAKGFAWYKDQLAKKEAKR